MGLKYHKRIPNHLNKLFNHNGFSTAQKKGFAFFSPLWTDSNFKMSSKLYYHIYNINDRTVNMHITYFITLIHLKYIHINKSIYIIIILNFVLIYIVS